jgi:multiple sugar transport system ATP-binding protein
MAFSKKIGKESKAEIYKRVRQAAEILQLTKYLDRLPKAMSGGQRQRVAIGRAIVRNPKVFLFDEPLSNLDAKLRVAMRAEIKALHQRLKTTTVYVTHDQIEAMTMADRIVVMHDGLVEQIGTPLELFDRPRNLFVAQFIGSPAMNVLAGTLRQREGRTWVEAQGQRWPAAAQVQGHDGQAVQYGVRPSDLRLSVGQGGIPASVVVVEPTGAETELLVRVGEAELVLVMHGRTTARPDDRVFLEVETASTHVFDAAGGQRLDLPPMTLQ